MLAARRLLRPAARRRERQFLVEGPQAVAAAASRGLLLEVFATAEAATRHHDVLVGQRLTVVGPRALASLADTVTPQGLIGVADLLDVPLGRCLPIGVRLVAVLVDVRDPGNAGTVLRTADAAGADAVIFADGPLGGCVDPHNSKCVRASAGSVFTLPFASGVPVAEAATALRAAGLQLLAADGYADTDLDAADAAGLLSRPTGWLFGTEAHGLPAAVTAAADRAVAVPRYGTAESLNLSSAAAVCLYASARGQRRPPVGAPPGSRAAGAAPPVRRDGGRP